MSNEQDIDALQGHAPDEEINPAKIGPAETEGPDENENDEEVGGRAVMKYAMKCHKCNAVSWIDYDTENYKAYRCAPCGAVNVL